jgi:hypothetical protein
MQDYWVPLVLACVFELCKISIGVSPALMYTHNNKISITLIRLTYALIANNIIISLTDALAFIIYHKTSGVHRTSIVASKTI